jgi:hypothetical protein
MHAFQANKRPRVYYSMQLDHDFFFKVPQSTAALILYNGQAPTNSVIDCSLHATYAKNKIARHYPFLSNTSKRDSVTRFSTSVFFHQAIPSGPDSQVKAFSNMASNSRSYSTKSVPERC